MSVWYNRLEWLPLAGNGVRLALQQGLKNMLRSADVAASAAGDIAKLALKRGLIKCQGKTPEATMASALYTDVKRKESNSVFIRPHEGLFGLREWADKGLVFKVGVLHC